MESLEELVRVLSIFSSIAISVSAIIGLLSVIFKPIRKLVVSVYKKIVGSKDKFGEISSKIEDMRSELINKIEGFKDDLTKQIQEVSDTNDENEKDRIRWEILNFANSCRNGIRHTKDEYTHIFDLNDKYEKLLEKTGEKNGYFEVEFEYIKHLYAERQEKNDFL